MATIKELQAQVTDLQTAVDAEQQQVADLLASQTQAISSLEQTITDLQAIIADGGTAEERQELANRIAEIKADLQNTVTSEDPQGPEVPQQF